MRHGLVRVTATFYPNYITNDPANTNFLNRCSNEKLIIYQNITPCKLSFCFLSNAAARAAVIGSHHQILDADWMLYCALALLAGHSKTNVSHSDTPGKLTL